MLEFLHVFQLRLVDLRRKRWSRENIPTKSLNPGKIQPTGRNFREFSPLFPSGTARRIWESHKEFQPIPTTQRQSLLEGFSWIEIFQLGIFSLKPRKIFPVWVFALNLGFLVPESPFSLRNPGFSSFPNLSQGGSFPPPLPPPKGKLPGVSRKDFPKKMEFSTLGKMFHFFF